MPPTHLKLESCGIMKHPQQIACSGSKAVSPRTPCFASTSSARPCSDLLCPLSDWRPDPLALPRRKIDGACPPALQQPAMLCAYCAASGLWDWRLVQPFHTSSSALGDLPTGILPPCRYRSCVFSETLVLVQVFKSILLCTRRREQVEKRRDAHLPQPPQSESHITSLRSPCCAPRSPSAFVPDMKPATRQATPDSTHGSGCRNREPRLLSPKRATKSSGVRIGDAGDW